MEAAPGLLMLLMLLGVSQGFEMSCDGRKNGSECYGPLGGAAVIQLMDDAAQIPRFRLIKDNEVRLNWVRRLLPDLSGSRYAFTSSNGTYRINDLSRNDGGTYTLNFIDEKTGEGSPQTLLLHVQEPVSSPRLSLGCLSLGERAASCVSEGGESPHYSWTLEGRALTDAELLSGSSSTANITLKQLVSGPLVCRVWNNVSSLSVSEQISTCGFIFVNCTSNGTQISEWVREEGNTLCVEAPVTSDPDSHTSITPNGGGSKKKTDNEDKDLLPMIAGVLSALLVLLVIGVAIVCTHRRKKSKLQREAEEEKQEPTYADVRVVQRASRRAAAPRPEPEVEYGQIKFSARPQQAEGRAEGDCVYAQVRRGR